MGVDSTRVVCFLRYAFYGVLGGIVMLFNYWFTVFSLMFLATFGVSFVVYGAQYRAGKSAIMAYMFSFKWCAGIAGLILVRYAIDLMYIYGGR